MPVSVDDALALALALASTVPAEDVPLTEAAGRTLAEDVRARDDLPRFDLAAMDGFAVRSSDLASRPSAPLRVLGDALAGDPFRAVVGSGEAVRIATGARLPEGADQVVELERTESGDAGVLVRADPVPFRNVRRRGEDLERGAVAISRGRVLGPPQIALLAAVGCSRPRCAERPRVAVLSTGDEIARAPGDDSIPDANGPALLAALGEAGAEPIDLGVARDERDEIAARLEGEGARRARAIVTTGGIAGTGPRDLASDTLSALGWREVLRGIAMRPGRPTSLYERDARLLFALPGNPVAALVAFTVIVAPAVARMLGRRNLGPRGEMVPSPEAFDEPAGRTSFVMACAAPDRRSGYTVTHVLRKGSAALVSLSTANVLLRVEGQLAKGDPVRAVFLRGGGP